MTNFLLLNRKLTIAFLMASLLIVSNAFSQQKSKDQLIFEDDPNLDQIPEWYLKQTANSIKAPSTVVTINDYDNFYLGVDFAESHISANPLDPTQFFTAYNIDGTHRTQDGHDWDDGTVVPWGTSVNGDPITAFDGAGNLYYESMFGGITGCKVARSADNGLSWNSVATAISGNDKNWMAADQTSGPYANYVYTVMTNSGSGNFARSTNQGVTWTTTFSPSTQSLPGMMVCVGPNGTTDGGSVYVVTNSGSSFAATYTFYRSTDGGATFSLMSAQNFAGYVGTNVSGRNSVENMRTRPYPFIAADQSNGPNRGRLYLVYASNWPAGDGNKPDIWCRYSDNGGFSWSSAAKINDDVSTQNNHQWAPAIWCDLTTGRLYVHWMDTRDDPTSAEAMMYASYSDNGISFATNKKLSNEPMLINCSSCGGGGTPRYQGDYTSIVSNGVTSMSSWADFRDGTFASFTGYFPDYAMRLSSSKNSTKGMNTVLAEVPDVKLYTDDVTFTATMETPPSGSFSIAYPSGNTLSTFPGSIPIEITDNSVPSGLYTLMVVGEGPNGTPVHKREISISVVELAPPVANFVASSVNPVVNTQVDFSDLSTNAPTSWSWSFNPSTVNYLNGTTSASENPQVEFLASGLYSVALVATNIYGSDTETKLNYIDVTNCIYCTTSYSNTSDDYISNVSFNTINNPSGSTNYSDFTSISTNVTAGNNYNISANITVNGSWLQHCWVWFDWNNDCDFDDAGEAFDLGETPGTSGTHTLSTNVLVPAGASLGSTRMRISELWNNNPGPCTNDSYGEAEDYTVVVQGSSSPPVADFSANTTTPAVGQTVNFTDLSANSPTSRSWSFNPTTITYVGGTNAGSQNPQVQFDASGYYTVTLYVTNIYGNDTEIKTDYILAGSAGNWTGNTNTNWSLNTNWENLLVPTSSDNVLIPASATNWPIYTGDFELGTQCLDVTMDGSSEMTVTGNMTIPSGRSFTCNGANILNIGGHWADNGSFTAGTGIVNFYSSVASDISAGGSAFGGGKFDDAGGGGYYTTPTYILFDCFSAFDLVSAKVYANGAGNRTFYWANSSGTVQQQAIINVPDGESRITLNFNITPGTDHRLGVSTTPNLYRNNSGVSYPYPIGSVGSATSSNAGTGYYYFYYDMEYSTGAGTETYNNLLISKDNNTVTSNADIEINGDLTVNSGAWFSNASGNTVNVAGDVTLLGDNSGKASFVDNGNFNVSGTTTVNSYYSDNRWHFISSPVSNAVSNIFLDIYLKDWDEATFSWNYITPTNNLLAVGAGYEIWSTIGNPTIGYTGGSLNSGNISPVLTATDVNGGGIGTGEGWNIVGQPYPSAIDWGTDNNPVPGYVKTNLDNAIYIWTGTQYATYNPALNGGNGLGTNGGSHIIQSMQSFFVKANNTNPALTIPNGARVHSAQANLKAYGDMQQLSLKVEGNGDSDEIHMEVNEFSTAGFDSEYDAYKLWGYETSPQLYVIVPDNVLSVYVVPEIALEDIINLGFKAGEQNTYTITAEQIENFDDYNFILLEDLLTGNIVNLLEVPLYSFTATPDDISERFRLKFTNDITGLGKESEKFVNIYSFGNTIFVQLQSEETGQEVIIYDMLGQEVDKQNSLSKGLNTISVDKGMGYYLVKVKSEGKIITEKVFLK